MDDIGRVKLADFGASTKIAMGETQETATIKGTPYFMAPEVLSQSKYGRKGDIWAVGCTIIQVCCRFCDVIPILTAKHLCEDAHGGSTLEE